MQTGRVLTDEDVIRLQRLESFARTIDARIEQERVARLEALKEQHAEFAHAVAELRRKHEETVEERNVLMQRAETAERKCELLAAKLASIVRRRQDLEGDEIRSTTNRILEEKNDFVGTLRNLAAEVSVDTGLLPNTAEHVSMMHESRVHEPPSSAFGRAGMDTTSFAGLPLLLSDATAVLQIVHAEVHRRMATLHACVSDFKRATSAAFVALSNCHILATRRIKGEDLEFVADTAASIDLHDYGLDEISSVGEPRHGLPPRRLDLGGGDGGEYRSDSEGGMSAPPAALNLDVHMIDAFRRYVTEALVELSQVRDLIKSRLERTPAEFGSHGGTGYDSAHATAHLQDALKRVTMQLQREVSRHAETRAVARAMIDAAESAQVDLLYRLCSSSSERVEELLEHYRGQVAAAATRGTSDSTAVNRSKSPWAALIHDPRRQDNPGETSGRRSLGRNISPAEV
jgi:hypothetical protein